MKNFQPVQVFKATLNFGLFLLGFFLIMATWWTHVSFGHVTVDQIISTLSFGGEGVSEADSTFFKKFALYCILLPIILAIIFTQLRFLRRLKYPIFLFGLAVGLHHFHVIGFVRSMYKRPYQDFFASNYVVPTTLPSKSNQTKSLVIIYVESLETTYSKVPLFNHDLLHNIDQLPNSFSFSDFQQVPGATWTIAGVIATQCGVPLKENMMLDHNQLGEATKRMLPAATCLSDVLHQHGYINVFMKGASLSFAGFSHFLSAHHYTQQYGKEEWLAIGVPASDMGGWGLYDDELFNQAKIQLTKLVKSNHKFNLSILTVDTHGVDGFVNRYCKMNGYADFQGIVECEGKEISNFVSFIKKNGWLDKLNIVIMGDHLAMVNALQDKIEKNQERRIFNTFITKQSFYKKTDTITHFDMLPTLLTLSGLHVKNERAGLGYNCIATSKKLSLKSSPPSNRIQEFNKQLEYSSQTYNQLWKTENKT